MWRIIFVIYYSRKVEKYIKNKKALNQCAFLIPTAFLNWDYVTSLFVDFSKIPVWLWALILKVFLKIFMYFLFYFIFLLFLYFLFDNLRSYIS